MFSAPNLYFRLLSFFHIRASSPFPSRNLASSLPLLDTHPENPKPKNPFRKLASSLPFHDNHLETPKPKKKSNQKRIQKQKQNGYTFCNNSTLTEKQKRVLKAVAEGRSIFITCSAGIGKSFLLKYVISVLKKIHSPKRVFVTASTGITACALRGQTLHSFAGIGWRTSDREELLLKAENNYPALKRWKTAEALVIDEISTIDGELFHHLEFIARKLGAKESYYGKYWHKFADNSGGEEQLWGGIQLVVWGDFFQLLLNPIAGMAVLICRKS